MEQVPTYLSISLHKYPTFYHSSLAIKGNAWKWISKD
jgi:hypothetical protein